MPLSATFKPDKIIIHHSASHDGPDNNTAAIRAYHRSLGWLDVGYHALIERVGVEHEIIIGRPWNQTGAHTLGSNDTALGICFVGNFNIEPPERVQLITGARFIAWWTRLLQIDPARIYPHSHFNSTDCPGRLFPFEQLLDFVRAAL